MRLPRRHLHQQAAAAGAESDFYSKLITIPSNLYGEVQKTGPMPRERYDDQLFNHTAFQEWLLQETVLKQQPKEPAPMAYRCGVFVNHAYKLIFIRNRKAASTTVLDTFKVGGAPIQIPSRCACDCVHGILHGACAVQLHGQEPVVPPVCSPWQSMPRRLPAYDPKTKTPISQRTGLHVWWDHGVAPTPPHKMPATCARWHASSTTSCCASSPFRLPSW